MNPTIPLVGNMNGASPHLVPEVIINSGREDGSLSHPMTCPVRPEPIAWL
jgi:hypothetical protein